MGLFLGTFYFDSRGYEEERPLKNRNIIRFYTCISCLLSLSRMSPRSMTITSWKRGAPCDPHCHLWPPPRSSTALRVSSGWICPRTPPSCLVSPFPSPSPRVHRVDWGCRRRRNPRRSLEWDFDALVRLSVTQRGECIVWNTRCVCNNSGKSKQRGWTEQDL